MIFKKILRLIIHEQPFLLRALLIFFLIGTILAEAKVRQRQSEQYAQFKKQKDLVMQIPAMEDTVRAHTITVMAAEAERPHPQPQVAKIEFDLQGTSIKNGTPFALIDKRIYKQGDYMGLYEVVTITRGSVLLRNHVTQDTKTLTLPRPAGIPALDQPNGPAK